MCNEINRDAVTSDDINSVVPRLGLKKSPRLAARAFFTYASRNPGT